MLEVELSCSMKDCKSTGIVRMNKDKEIFYPKGWDVREAGLPEHLRPRAEARIYCEKCTAKRSETCQN